MSSAHSQESALQGNWTLKGSRSFEEIFPSRAGKWWPNCHAHTGETDHVLTFQGAVFVWLISDRIFKFSALNFSNIRHYYWPSHIESQKTVFYRSVITHHSQAHVCVYHTMLLSSAGDLKSILLQYNVPWEPLFLHLFALAAPQLLPGVTCILDVIPALSSHSQFVISVDVREACGGGRWVSRLKPTSPMLSLSDLNECNWVFMRLWICSLHFKSPGLFFYILVTSCSRFTLRN